MWICVRKDANQKRYGLPSEKGTAQPCHFVCRLLRFFPSLLSTPNPLLPGREPSRCPLSSQQEQWGAPRSRARAELRQPSPLGLRKIGPIDSGQYFPLTAVVLLMPRMH